MGKERSGGRMREHSLLFCCVQERSGRRNMSRTRIHIPVCPFSPFVSCSHRRPLASRSRNGKTKQKEADTERMVIKVPTVGPAVCRSFFLVKRLADCFASPKGRSKKRTAGSSLAKSERKNTKSHVLLPSFQCVPCASAV